MVLGTINIHNLQSHNLFQMSCSLLPLFQRETVPDSLSIKHLSAIAGSLIWCYAVPGFILNSDVDEGIQEIPAIFFLLFCTLLWISQKNLPSKSGSMLEGTEY